MIKNKIAKSLSVLFITVGFYACKKRDFDKVYIEPWKPSIAAPLINGSLSMKDIAENIDKNEINVIEGPDGLYTLIYRDTLESDYAETYIKVPDQLAKENYGLTLTENTRVNLGETVTNSESYAVTINTENGQELKYADLKGGILNFSVTSTLPHHISLDIGIPSFTKNGVPFATTLDLTYNGSSPVEANISEALEGYRLDLSGDGTQSNTFLWNADITVTSSGEVSVGNESVQIDLGLNNLQYSLLYGNLGSFTFPSYDGFVNIEVFDNAEQGEVVFNDPKLKLTLNNTFGVPAAFTINQLETETDYGMIVDFSSTGNLQIPGPNIIEFPTTVGQNALTDYSLDKTNSNIVDAFKPAPSRLNYSLTPGISSSGMDNHFVLDTSRIKAYTEAEIPLDGTIKIYSLVDTIRGIEFQDEENIRSALLKIKTINSLPLDVTLQAYWLDNENNILDTLFLDNTLIVSGQVNNNGEVTAATTYYQEIYYDRERYEKIIPATKLLVEGDLQSSNNGNTPVKFFSHNEITLQISTLVNTEFEIE